MNRRDSLRALGIGTLSTGTLLAACKQKKGNTTSVDDTPLPTGPQAGRQAYELGRDARLHKEAFFSEEEMAAITVLSDIIIPKDEHSGSASDAKVPDFIEFMAKDLPEHQLPLRGGLRWVNRQCLNRYGKAFTDCSHSQQIELVEMIAYPEQAKPEMQQGVAFFNLMRDLTATGFFSSQMGVKDLGFVGNTPNRWNGVPDDVLKQYGIASASI
jgi:hypothetical protein